MKQMRVWDYQLTIEWLMVPRKFGNGNEIGDLLIRHLGVLF